MWKALNSSTWFSSHSLITYICVGILATVLLIALSHHRALSSHLSLLCDLDGQTFALDRKSSEVILLNGCMTCYMVGTPSSPAQKSQWVCSLPTETSPGARIPLAPGASFQSRGSRMRTISIFTFNR